jgi:hypothetical protein
MSDASVGFLGLPISGGAYDVSRSVEWDEFTSFIATTDDIKLLLFRLNETASYHESEKERDWALRMYAWVVAMTNNELAGSK